MALQTVRNDVGRGRLVPGDLLSVSKYVIKRIDNA